MDNILTATTVIVPVILGLTGVAKTMIKDNKWLPIINIVIGIFIGAIYALTIVKADVAIYAWAGVLAGLTAGGFYDLGANGKGLVNQSKATKLIDEGNGKQDTREDGE